jgi:Cdc6-like AAA superfamily ATPase
VVLTGFRGHGKHMLLSSCLAEVSSEHAGRRRQAGAPPSPFARVVELNALTLPDEHSCHREIASQLSASPGSVLPPSSYLSNTEVFHRALLHSRAEGVPLLFVLSELDHFAMQNKQVFL